MDKICIFAGTTEGRELAQLLSDQPLSVLVCVATEYGESLLLPEGNLAVHTGRLTQPEMEALFRREGFSLVVDATHPYAGAVTENICQACRATGTEYLRLLRQEGAAPEDALFVKDIEQAVAFLSRQEGNILLTTGSKELNRYTGIAGFETRVYPRVLPMEDSLRLCREAGVKPSHILAMQGPFTREMNVAMLKSVQAAFLVTKDSGDAGGFSEKAEAARQAGARLVVIGRPPQVEGQPFDQVVKTLAARWNLTFSPEVTVVGIGPGCREQMTQAVKKALEEGQCLIGAKRMLQAAAFAGKPSLEAIHPEKIAALIAQHPEYRRFVVVMSGDVGFFSGTKKLLPLLKHCRVTLEPGISSLVYLCSRLETGYEDVVPVSLHGRQGDICAQVRRYGRIFLLTGGENAMGNLCRQLTEAGMGDTRVSVGAELGYPSQEICTGTAAQLAEKTFPSLCAALIEGTRQSRVVTQGLPDEAFRRSREVPMTKQEVRSVSLAKLALTEDAVAWDVGAGTGSVSLEMARLASRGQVYAIEKKQEALALLAENRRAFALDNLTIVPGTAPEACADLPAPTHVFVGGSSGNLRQILELVLQKNPQARIVVNAIALESIAELNSCMAQLPVKEREMVCLTVARERAAGVYHLMMGQNPVYIGTIQGGTV